MCQHVRDLSPDRNFALRMTYSPYLDRARLQGKLAIKQMAHDFQMFAANAGSVSQDDLEILGWTRAQITLLVSDARQYANRSADK
jgi:hypothetical protein